jgi:hypothetical protein
MSEFTAVNSSNFRPTSKALRAFDLSNMGIGDGLREDLPDYVPPKQGRKDGSRAVLEKLREEILGEINYCPPVPNLARRIAVALAYPPGNRPENLAWTTYEATKSLDLDPVKSLERLNIALTAAAKAGKVLTREIAKKALQKQNEEAKRAVKIAKIEVAVEKAREVLASPTATSKQRDRAVKIRDGATRAIEQASAPRKPREPRRVNLKTMVNRFHHVVDIISELHSDLLDFDEAMSAGDRDSLDERCHSATSILTNIREMLPNIGPAYQEVEAAE